MIFADNSAQLATLCDTIYHLEQGRIAEVAKPAEDQESALPFKIPVRLEGSVVLLNPADLLYALAQEGKAYLQTSTRRYPSQFTMNELEDALRESSGKAIGIAVPAGFDDQLSENNTAALEGFAAHWVNPEDIDEMRTILEAKITWIAGKPVSIDTGGNENIPGLTAGAGLLWS